MSIRARLLWLALLATLLPALLQTSRHVQERNASIDANTDALIRLAQRRADDIGVRVQGTAQLLFGLARARDLATEDRGACSAFLSRVRDAFPQFTGILTVRADGSLFCDSLNIGRQLDLRDRSYFKAAQTTREPLLLESAFGRLTGLPVLQVAHPVRAPNGELSFLLLASLNLAKLVEAPLVALPGASLLLLDNQGMVLATSRSDAQREVPGSMLDAAVQANVAALPAGSAREFAGQDGQRAMWASAETEQSRRAGLRVLARMPSDTIVADADGRLLQDLLLLALLALGVFTAVWLVAERAVRRPVARITQMASELAAGDLAARIPSPLPRGELGALMMQLNHTAQALQKQRDDIAELGDKLRHSQRLDAVGQLTGGVAHDFNNLLTVVLGNAELLVDLNRDHPQQRQLAEMIGSAALRGAELTQRLLAFARKQALDPKVVDLNQLLVNMHPMLRRSLGEHIDIACVPRQGLWTAVVDQGQLENALLNLCLNARDAMPQGGSLTLETANVTLDAAYAAQNVDVAPGAYVVLAVSDTGQGIAPQHLLRVFEPFFTTKPPGKGTGLGLAMVYGFIKQSGGHTTVYSEPGQGTTVKLYLPRAVSPVVQDGGKLEPALIPGGTGTVLLVEDDDVVRRFAGEQLRSFGYTVVEAADGPQALAIVQTRADIDVLFTDVVMPGGMSGRALADAALQLRPGLAVLYTSGYTENAIVHHGRLDSGTLFLAKPYRRSDLDRMVRAARAAAAAMSTAG